MKKKKDIDIVRFMTSPSLHHPEVALGTLRATIGDVINRASYAGERVVVTRNGKPAAALISAEDLAYFEDLERAADQAALTEARADDDGHRISIEEHAANHGIAL